MILPQKLETDKLLLRPLLPEDFEGFYAFISDDKAMRPFVMAELEKTKDGARRFFDDLRSSYDTPHPVFAMAIIEKKNDRFVGCCGLTPTHGGRSTESIVMILRRYWGKGYGTDTARVLIDYAFEKLGVERVLAYGDPASKRTMKFATKLNMKLDGVIQHEGYTHQVRQYSIENPHLPAD